MGRDFAAEADACGLSDCLRCLVLSRVFTIIYDEWPTEKTRLLFEEIERLGYPGIDLLISLRTIWADVLAEAGEDDEARSVARLLKQDMEEYARLHAGQASNEQFIDTLTWLHEQFHV